MILFFSVKILFFILSVWTGLSKLIKYCIPAGLLFFKIFLLIFCLYEVNNCVVDT